MKQTNADLKRADMNRLYALLQAAVAAHGTIEAATCSARGLREAHWQIGGFQSAMIEHTGKKPSDILDRARHKFLAAFWMLDGRMEEAAHVVRGYIEFQGARVGQRLHRDWVHLADALGLGPHLETVCRNNMAEITHWRGSEPSRVFQQVIDIVSDKPAAAASRPPARRQRILPSLPAEARP